MDYVGNIIRPPSEANSIILQVTVGCSHNKCIFCPTYKGVRFALKDRQTILNDIEFARRYFRNAERLFITDGDALVLPTEKLLWLLDRINERLPWLKRIGIYANAKAIATKSTEELKQLKERKLGIIYYGIESGDDETLAFVKKGADSKKLLEEGLKVKQAGITLSVTVLLGVAGKRRSRIHAVRTGQLLTQLDPEYASALTLIVVPGTPLWELYRTGSFELPDKIGMLKELKAMLEHTHMSGGLFTSNHASNYLPLKVRMPSEKQAALTLLERAIKGEIPLKEEWMRAL